MEEEFETENPDIEWENREDDIDVDWENYDDFETKKEFVDEATAFERAGGFGHVLGTTIAEIGGGDPNQILALQKRYQRANLTPEETFSLELRTIVMRFNSDNIYKLDDTFISHLNDNLYKVKHIAEKNPLGYLLGSLVISNGEISKKNFEMITKNILPKLKLDKNKTSYEGIAPEDIIRYGRMWLNIKVGIQN